MKINSIKITISMKIRLKKQKAKNVEKLIKAYRNTFCLFVASLKLGCRFISLLLFYMPMIFTAVLFNLFFQ